MKQKTKIVFLWLCLIAIEINSQQISPLIMGQNYWGTSYNAGGGGVSHQNPNIFGGGATSNAVWPQITASGVKLMRVGGKAYNTGEGYDAKPTAGAEIYYVKIIDDIRAHGCEPVLTIPFTLTVTGASSLIPTSTAYINALSSSTANAQEIIRLVNVVHKRNVKYVIIGNEPDKDYGWDRTTTSISATTVANNIAGYVKPMAIAIKEIDPTIKIIGPELSWYDVLVYNELFDNTNINGANCIAGVIPGGSAAGLPYVDFLSYHLYLYEFQDENGAYIGPDGYSNLIVPAASTNSWSADISKVYTTLEKYARSWTESKYGSGKHARGTMRDVKLKCNAISANTARNGFALGWMITEMNSSHHNEITTSGTDNVSGSDTRSLRGAQNIARLYALAMEYGCTSVMMWSVKEGAASGQFAKNDRGYLDAANANKRHSYFHFQAMSKYFHGSYLKDKELEKWVTDQTFSEQTEPNPCWLHYSSQTSTTSTNPCLSSHYDPATVLETKAFAAKNNSIVVMVLNHSANEKSFVIDFNSNTSTNHFPHKQFSFAAGVAVTTTFAALSTATTGYGKIPGESTDLLIFDCAGTLKVRKRYLTSGMWGDVLQPGGTENNLASVAGSSAACINNQSTQVFVDAPGATNFTWYKLPSTTPLSTITGSIGSNLEAGVYRTVVSGGTWCAASEIATVVHYYSPLVDAGEDRNLCTNTVVTIGNTTIQLPAGQSYVWQPGGATSSVTTTNTNNISSNVNYSLTATANGCSLTDLTLVTASQQSDLMFFDSPHDIGNQPNLETDLGMNKVFWNSLSIWNTTATPTSTVPVFENPQSYATNYLNLHVYNRSCVPVSNATITVYKSHASTGGYWGYDWGLPSPKLCNQYANNNTCGTSTITCGDLMFTYNLGTLSPLQHTVAVVSWTPPPVADYSCTSAQAIQWGHWCYLAHLDQPSDELQPGTFSLVTSPWYQAYGKNNVAWKNLITLEGKKKDIPQGGCYLVNIGANPYVDVTFRGPRGAPDRSVFGSAQVFATMSPNAISSWVNGGRQGRDVLHLNDTTVEILSDSARMEHVFIPQNEYREFALQIVPTTTVDIYNGKYFELSLAVYAEDSLDQPLGGVEYLIDKSRWVCESCAVGDEDFAGIMMNSQSFSDQDLYISDSVIVSNGVTLALNKVNLKFAENARVIVLQGGKLIVQNCQLTAACQNKKWGGIEVLGSPGAIDCLTITSSYFKDTESPVILNRAEGISISNNAFLGNGKGTAIQMEKGKDFVFHGNTFKKFEKGIETTKSKNNDSYSYIEKNLFSSVKTGITMFKDDHLDLVLQCNRFEYSDYAIVSDSSSLNDVGDLAAGAGNKFVSTSVLANNKLKHNNGNSPKYYYNPGDSTNYIGIQLLSAQNMVTCYPADSSFSRPAITSIARLNKTSGLALSAVPNPNDGRADLHYSLGKDKAGTIEVRDIEGRLLDQIKIDGTRETVNINYGSYASGIYIITLISPTEGALNKKMIITR